MIQKNKMITAIAMMIQIVRPAPAITHIRPGSCSALPEADDLSDLPRELSFSLSSATGLSLAGVRALTLFPDITSSEMEAGLGPAEFPLLSFNHASPAPFERNAKVTQGAGSP
ncbi:hypothetical protein [Parasphingorhabdus litoris]|uniref:hypothetical protein n=1 Tax=Parasphingorhabdus litoris TaxID=394733 RepID=UPI001E476849|nr:hypothetical protein [Parasphingorhabdus litoris]